MKLILTLSFLMASHLLFAALPPLYKSIKEYDTNAVILHFNSGGAIDFDYTEKIATSSKGLKGKKVTVTLLERAIWSYNEAREMNEPDNLVCARRNVELILSHLHESVNFKEQVNKAFTLIVPTGDVELVKKLYELGADINHRCEMCYGRPAILIAIGYHENFELIKYLLSLKPDLTITDYDGRGFLDYAASHGNLQLIKYFVETLNADVNISDKFGESPLMTAASLGFYDVFNYLVTKGADLNIKNKKGHTILHKAAESGNFAFFSHVFYLTGIDLWSADWGTPDILKFAYSEELKVFIARYTIAKWGAKKYKKLKRRYFFKRITFN